MIPLFVFTIDTYKVALSSLFYQIVYNTYIFSTIFCYSLQVVLKSISFRSLKKSWSFSKNISIKKKKKDWTDEQFSSKRADYKISITKVFSEESQNNFIWLYLGIQKKYVKYVKKKALPKSATFFDCASKERKNDFLSTNIWKYHTTTQRRKILR